MDANNTETRIAKLVTELKLAQNGLRLSARIEAGYVVFSGGRQGEASIALDVSSAARVLAHWDGYCVANGCRSQPAIGQLVTFQRGMFGSWTGRVVRACATSALIAYTRRNGSKAQRRVRLQSVQF
jgi:hypothetical protein